MRLLIIALSYILALALVAVLALVGVLGLAGPHAGLLPSGLEAVVLGLGWLAVFGLPVLIARRVWRRLGRAGRDQGSPSG